jgi:hypothetical protein
MNYLHRAGLALVLIAALPVEAQVPLSEDTFRESRSSKCVFRPK